MFKKSRARKEIAAGWQWMRKQDPKQAAAAEQWAKDHPDEMKSVDRILYDSEDKYYKHNGFAEMKEVEARQSLNADDYLLEDVKDRIYDDKVWFVRKKYLPAGVEGDSALHLYQDVAEGLEKLTELQREVLFRSVINQEPIAAIAKAKGCSERNIRDIRNRALKALRGNLTKDGHGFASLAGLLIIIFLCLACNASVAYFAFLADTISWFQTFCRLILPFTLAGAWSWYRKAFRDGDMWRLREYWHWLQVEKTEGMNEDA